jgi:hypothetical protein
MEKKIYKSNLKSENKFSFTEGYWASDQDPEKDNYKGIYPCPTTSSFPQKDVFLEKLSKVENMLTNLQINENKKKYVLSYRGLSTCRICNNFNGSKEYIIDFSEGEVNWPEGFSHYVEVHGVRPSDRFVEIIMSKK